MNNHKLIKISIFVISFAFSLQQISRANDITEFEIDGISIGESALNHFTEKEISEARDESYEDKEFITKTLLPKGSSSYEIYQITYKSLDKKKELHGINGVITFPKNINECKKLMKEISSELSILFPFTEKKDWGKYDMSEGHYFPITFTFENNSRVMVACYDWNKKSGITDSLKLSLYTSDYRKYLAKQKQ